MTYTEWCELHDCDHAHCPFDCEHPQPMVHGGRLLCMRCWFIERVETECVPCRPDVCDD